MAEGTRLHSEIHRTNMTEKPPYSVNSYNQRRIDMMEQYYRQTIGVTRKIFIRCGGMMEGMRSSGRRIGKIEPKRIPMAVEPTAIYASKFTDELSYLAKIYHLYHDYKYQH
ncbi:hypothetical protein PV326_003562 [Microctonus aethiopoides]|nr:hypothetical protein PV326_003562 [Microctonus aethiopoides]